MCGIAGIIDFRGGIDRGRLTRLRERLHHRGPDGRGITELAHAGLVHTRLALVDAAGGAQPLASDDGRYTLVYNGEVYNASELRDTLRHDWHFQTRCDAEVVLAAYAHWGAACVPRLNGMFAFFVWDTRADAGFAARDLLGVKPFVYAHRGEEVVFASEAKAILDVLPGPRRARRSAVLEYLTAPCFSGVEAPMFEGLEYLAPGHCLHVTREGICIDRWGEHSLHEQPSPVAPEELRTAFEEAVRRTMVADVPVSVFLSGGLDSTAIAAAARVERAYTIRFEAQERFDYARSRIVISDDEPFADLAARELGLRRTLVHVDRASLALDLAHLAATNDALPAWEQELAQHHLARAAARDYKAALVGDAADETHFGYHFLLDNVATSSPRAILERFGASIVRRDVLGDPTAHFDAHYRTLVAAAGHDWETREARVLATTWLVVHRWLPRLLHNGDIHGMAHGLEARVPFADHSLLAIARRVGPVAALAGGMEKAALRAALKGLVPEPIRTRRKSALPKDQEVAAIYQREAAALLADGALGDLIDLAAAHALCEPARRLDERERALLFRLICLVHWARTYEVQL